ncbi:MAG: hypothetical protein IPJ65_13460 [Archangiaceae bacterium]|nr:hypothetical protein [Archangiaceae bacterium]
MLPALVVLALLSQATTPAQAEPPPAATPAPNDPRPPERPAVKTPVPNQDTYGRVLAQENQPGLAGANPPTADLGEWWRKIHPFGYVKTGVFYTFPFSNEQLVGGNGGFRVAAARLGVELLLVDNLSVVTSIELAAPNLNPADPLTGGRFVEMRDAYLEYRVCRGFWVRAGQFKAPFNGETLLGDADLPFITRSVATDGVNPPDGYGPREGLTMGRQIGLMLSSDRLGGHVLGFRYFVAGVNGNGQNQLFNENNLIAPVARLELELFERVRVAVNGFYNVVAIGTRPNRINQSQLGFGADATLRVAGLRMLVGLVGRQNSYASSDMASVLPSDTSMGLFAQLHYVFDALGLEAGVRFGWYEPSTAQFDDRAWELNGLLAYRFKKVPLRVLLQYTHREEEPAVAIGNESIDAMVQVTW